MLILKFIFSVKSCKYKKKFKAIEGGPVFCLHFVQSTQTVWAGTDLPGRSIVLLSPKGKALDQTLVGHSKKVNMIIEANGLVWSCSSDKTIMIWKHDGECVRLLQGHAGPIFSIAETGSHVWSAGWDKKVILWDSEVCFSFFLFFKKVNY